MFTTAYYIRDENMSIRLIAEFQIDCLGHGDEPLAQHLIGVLDDHEGLVVDLLYNGGKSRHFLVRDHAHDYRPFVAGVESIYMT